jgi:hypothetical protein
MLSIKNNNSEITRLLANHPNCDVNLECGLEPLILTPLMKATMLKQSPLVTALLDTNKANVNLTDHVRITTFVFLILFLMICVRCSCFL